MKQSFLLLILLLLVSSSTVFATFVARKDGFADRKTPLKEINTNHEVSFEKLESNTEPLFDEPIMGLEDCNGKVEDEECVKRRMIAEAHLDYIYTQKHKP